MQAITLFCLLGAFAIANAAEPQITAANTIKNIEYSTLPGNRIQISLELSEPAVTPLSFTINNPARIAFDFAELLLEILC